MTDGTIKLRLHTWGGDAWSEGTGMPAPNLQVK